MAQSYQQTIELLVRGQTKLRAVTDELKAANRELDTLETKTKAIKFSEERAKNVLRGVGRDIPRTSTGKFAKDPNRKQRQQALRDERTAERRLRLNQAREALQRRGVQRLQSQQATQNRILQISQKQLLNQTKLNAANDLYGRRLQEFARAGGNTNTKLKQRVDQIRQAFKVSTQGGTENLEQIQAFNTELGRIVEKQRELNRLRNLKPKGFERARRLQERIDVVEELGGATPQQIKSARTKAAGIIAAADVGNAALYTRAVEDATAATSRLERESNKVRVGLSKAQKIRQSAILLQEKLKTLEAQGVDVTEAKSRVEKVIFDTEQKSLNLSKKSLKNLSKEISDVEDLLRLERQRLSTKNAQAKGGRNRLGSAFVGAAFPALFGAGPASILGGFVGELFGPLGGVVGSALAAPIDEFVKSVAQLGNALNPLTADIGALATASGEANTEVGQALESIKSLGTENQALTLATQLLADTVGTQGVAALQDFGDDTTRLANAFSAAMAQMQAAFAQAFGGILGKLANFIQETVDIQAGLANETDPELQLLKAQRTAITEQALPKNVVDAVLDTPLDTLEALEVIDGKIAARARELRKDTEDRILGENNILKTKEAINSLGLQDTKVTQLQTKLAGLKNDLTNSEVVATKKALINRREELKIEEAKKALTKDGKLDKAAFDKTSEKIRNEFAVERLKLNTQIGEAQERAAKKAQTASKQQAEQQKRARQFTGDLQNQLNVLESSGSLEGQRQKIQRDYERTLARISNLKNQDFRADQEALANQIRQTQLANVEQEAQQKRAAAIRSAVEPIRNIREQQEASVAATQEYNRLLMEGVLPAEAKRITEFNKQVEAQIRQKDELIAITELDILRAEAIGAATKKLKENLDLLKKERKAIENEAAKGPGKGRTSDQDIIEDRVAQLKGELTEMTKLGNVVIQVADNIGAAFSTAFQEVINGSKSTQEALSDMFKTIGESFVQMAAEIIAKQLIMITLQAILKALGAAGGGGSGGAPDPNSANVGSVLDSGGFTTGNLADQASAGTFSFSSPRANGGPVQSGQPYIVGEEGPELFIPGTSGLISNNDQFEAARAALVEGAGLSDEEKEAVENPGTSQQPSQLNQILKDSRSAVQTINQITKERETASVNSITKELAAAATNGAASGLLGSSTTTNNVLKEILGSDTSSENNSTSIQQIAQAEAVTAAREALVEQKVGEGIDALSDAATSSENNSTSIQQIAQAEAAMAAREALVEQKVGEGLGALSDGKLVEKTGSSVTNNSSSSTFSTSRSAIDRVTALNQTRQMLQSTSSVTKERSVERASENQGAASMQPLDVRYESQVINNVEYVTAEQHRRGLAEAAERGRAMTLQTLQTSVKSRRKVGLA